MNRSVVLISFVLLSLALFDAAHSQGRVAPHGATNAEQRQANGSRGKGDVAEDFVVCTGWHALCSDSPDCLLNRDTAQCNCARVNENHIIATSEIQDPVAKRDTLNRCTQHHPCEVDEAPVCQTIKDGRYEVDRVTYNWVSTYSYRGWCSILQKGFKVCDPQAPGYTGDRNWAICDGAPCSENPYPANGEKPLTCQCRVDQSPFVGIDSCTGVNGGIMSSFPAWAWDFQRNTYPFAMPGYEYVQGACAALRSDRLP